MTTANPPRIDNLQTEFEIVAEQAWSYKLPEVKNLDENQVIVRLIDIGRMPWLEFDSQTNTISIAEGAAKGNSTIGSYPFSVELQYSNRQTSDYIFYPMTIQLVQPSNEVPTFVNDELYPVGTKLSFIARQLYTFAVPEIVDPDSDVANITVTV